MSQHQVKSIPPRDLPADRPQGFVVGTAGHVDHGKSTLVKALTGIDPDRLAEEKARAMTIDLGFAWLTLPSGRAVSIVDVPGHERFIKNMLAGVGGIDAALLVVAADEGPMPQTAEHLAILDLLGIDYGLVVLTKVDAVDQDWLDLVHEETRERLRGTRLAAAPLIPVSALTGQGLPELRSALDLLLANIASPGLGHRPRLPIDRVFTVTGFGTVVTGTLSGGDLTVGQELRVYPRDLQTRVRGLQTHQTKVERALPGSRVAVNLTNLAVDDLRRGDLLAPAGLLTPTQRIDARLRLLDDAPHPLAQNAEVDFFVGAAELPARLTLLDRELLGPGAEGWVQIRFREPIAVLKGDRFILRRPSPSLTIGGGEVIDPTPLRHRRFRPEVIDNLETRAAGAPDELVLQELDAGPRDRRALRQGTAGLDAQQVDQALAQLLAEGDIVLLGARPDEATPRPGDFFATSSWFAAIEQRLRSLLAAFHASQPLRRGMAKEEVKSRLRLSPPRLFDDAFASAAAAGWVIADAQTVRLPAFQISLDGARRGTADRYLAALAATPFTPPAPTDFGLDPETLGALEHLNELVEVATGVVFNPAALDRLVAETLAMIDRDGSLTLAQFRDHFGSSRKYAQATLEFLDQRRITRRVGDERIRFVGPGAAVWHPLAPIIPPETPP